MNTLTLGSLKNLSSHKIETICLEHSSGKIRPYFETHNKEAFRKWCNDTNTEWMFYSGFLGLNPHERVTKENPAHLMRALVIDYDVYSYTDSSIKEALEGHSKNRGIAPNFISRTYSGGIRALWVFEEPIQVLTNEIAEIFVNELNEYVRGKLLFAGLDEKALNNISQYYEFAQNWVEFEDLEWIKGETVHRILAKAVSKANRYHNYDTHFQKIPLEIVHKEVCERFPGRWDGPFEVGSRGVRFWDPNADAHSAIIKEDGVVCFTGDSKFKSWSDIFGREFVEKYCDETVGKIIKNIFSDGKNFFYFDDQNKKFTSLETHQLRWKFENDFLVKSTSQQNTVLNQILNKNRVDYTAPIVHRSIGVMDLNGRRVLNTWVNKTAQMTESIQLINPQDSFPFLYELWFNNGFNPQDQLDYFLAWMKRAYLSGLNLKPTRGQVLVIAGPPNSGKSLTAEILSLIFGASCDASRYLKGESIYNGHLFEAFLWIVDDAVVSASEKTRTTYSSNLKKVAADNRFEYSEKYQKGGPIEWNGRVIVTCNEDEISLSAVPDIFQSNEDKIILLRMSDNSQKFSDKNILEEIRKEIPYFLRWLVDQWQTPDHVIGSSRFGVVPYKNEAIWSASVESHDNYRLEEIVDIYLTEYFKSASKEIKSVQWQVSELLENFQGDGSPVKSSTKILNTKRLGVELKKLLKSNTFKGTHVTIYGRKYYRFYKKDFPDTSDSEAQGS